MSIVIVPNRPCAEEDHNRRWTSHRRSSDGSAVTISGPVMARCRVCRNALHTAGATSGRLAKEYRWTIRTI